MKKTDKRINYGYALSVFSQFPGNPFLIHRIQDAILALSGQDMLTMTVREAAQNKRLKGAINLIYECHTDNKRMALETFGYKLVADVLEYTFVNRETEPESDDLPNGLFQRPGVFGYLGDN